MNFRERVIKRPCSMHLKNLLRATEHKVSNSPSRLAPTSLQQLFLEIARFASWASPLTQAASESPPDRLRPLLWCRTGLWRLKSNQGLLQAALQPCGRREDSSWALFAAAVEQLPGWAAKAAHHTPTSAHDCLQRSSRRWGPSLAAQLCVVSITPEKSDGDPK